MVGAEFNYTGADRTDDTAAVVPVMAYRGVVDGIADHTFAVSGDTAPEIVVIRGIDGGVLRAVVDETAF